MEVQTETDRHLIRFMFKFLVFVGILFFAGKMIAQKKSEFYGISESEARSKLETKLSSRLGEEKASEIVDQIIPRLLDKGVIKADEAVDATESVVDDAKDAVEEVVED